MMKDTAAKATNTGFPWKKEMGLRWEKHGEAALAGVATETLWGGDVSGKNERWGASQSWEDLKGEEESI